LEILGRADNAVTTGGQTVAPERVEAALRELPWVADALVAGLPDPEWGEALAALVVDEDGCAAHPAEARSHVKARLGAAWAPRWLGVVPALPEAAPGKKDRRAGGQLAERLAAAGALRRLGTAGGGTGADDAVNPAGQGSRGVHHVPPAP
jgi:O-succinylbenzoic acid--CoA ligase